MSEIFSGILENGRGWQRAEIEIKDKLVLHGHVEVAIVGDAKEFATNAILFERGFRVIVFVDGHNLGVLRKDGESLRMDDSIVVEVVHAAGEQLGDGDGTWFARPAGLMLAWGTRKAPATSPSRVRPEDLAMAAARLLRSSSTEH